MYRALIALLLSAAFISPANANTPPATFSFTGSGLGHGVGLSQIGAKALANQGKSAEEILSYYYTGVKVEPEIDNFDLKINIGHLLTAANLQLVSKTGFLKINDYQISDNQSIATFKYTPSGIATQIKRNKLVIANLPAANNILIQWSGTRFLPGDPALIAFNPGKSIQYQYGQIDLTIAGKSFEATNTVRLKDEYLYGVSEVSSAWPKESLRAQAIAARTYALNKGINLRPSCLCNLYGTTQDQVFVGATKLLEPKYGQFWREAVDSTSVDETQGLAITYKGFPISAYYSSSTAGMTESALNAFGTAVDYLQPVADPWSIDPNLNPRYVNWSRTVSQQIVAKAFLLPDVVKLVIKGKRIEATSSTGAKFSLRLETFRSRAVLPSPFFTIV
jgi:SpoIID/LytB domain protein